MVDDASDLLGHRVRRRQARAQEGLDRRDAIIDPGSLDRPREDIAVGRRPPRRHLGVRDVVRRDPGEAGEGAGPQARADRPAATAQRVLEAARDRAVHEQPGLVVGGEVDAREGEDALDVGAARRQVPAHDPVQVDVDGEVLGRGTAVQVQPLRRLAQHPAIARVRASHRPCRILARQAAAPAYRGREDHERTQP